jgi:excisionase family DNA binding protein
MPCAATESQSSIKSRKQNQTHARNRVASRMTKAPEADVSSLPELTTILEFCRVMRIGRTAAYRMVASGELPSLRVGRHIRIPRWAYEGKDAS